MSASSSDRQRAAVVVAHPDDETLWFSSVFARFQADIICVTCGWDDETRERRSRLPPSSSVPETSTFSATRMTRRG